MIPGPGIRRFLYFLHLLSSSCCPPVSLLFMRIQLSFAVHPTTLLWIILQGFLITLLYYLLFAFYSISAPRAIQWRRSFRSDSDWTKIQIKYIGIGAATALVAQVRTLPTSGNPTWTRPILYSQVLIHILLGPYHLFNPGGTPDCRVDIMRRNLV